MTRECCPSTVDVPPVSIPTSTALLCKTTPAPASLLAETAARASAAGASPAPEKPPPPSTRAATGGNRTAVGWKREPLTQTPWNRRRHVPSIATNCTARACSRSRGSKGNNTNHDSYLGCILQGHCGGAARRACAPKQCAKLTTVLRCRGTEVCTPRLCGATCCGEFPAGAPPATCCCRFRARPGESCAAPSPRASKAARA